MMSSVLSAPNFWFLLIVLQTAQAQTLHYLGQQIVPHGYEYAGTRVGGLSGIDYDPTQQRFVLISDDRSEHQPARFYTLELDLAAFNRREQPGFDGVRFTGVTTLRTSAGLAHDEGTVDPESIRFSLTSGRRLWTSEGNAKRGIPPMLEEVGADGTALRRFEIPPYYLPTRERGVRDNLSFESLAVDAISGRLYVGTENALQQDGPTSDLNQPSASRLLVFDGRSGERLAEHVYQVDAVTMPPPLPLMFRTNGLVELLGGEGMLLALERAYTQGVGNSARIYRLDLADASNVAGMDTLVGKAYRPVRKTLLLDLGTTGIHLDNLEGMTWGPRMPNGQRSLIFVSDDNFSSRQVTQFLAFELN
jgi:hypothetical protein